MYKIWHIHYKSSRKMNKEEPCLKIEIKAKFGTKHKNINRTFHPTIGPPKGFINPMIHP
jgi:hypothetical protein